jgi:hypothetical protein
MFQKNALWRHAKRCTFKTGKAERDHQKQGKLLLPVPKQVSDAYKTDILGSMAAG